MKTNIKKNCRPLLFLAIVLFYGINHCKATVITVSSTTNWSSLGTAPTNADEVDIEGGATLTVDVNNAVCGKMLIGVASNGDGALTFTGSNNQLTITTAGALDGSLTIAASGTTGALTFNSSSTLILDHMQEGSGTPVYSTSVGTFEVTGNGYYTLSNFSDVGNLIIAPGGLFFPTTHVAGPFTIHGNLSGSGQFNGDGGGHQTVVTGDCSCSNVHDVNDGILIEGNFTGTFHLGGNEPIIVQGNCTGHIDLSSYYFGGASTTTLTLNGSSAQTFSGTTELVNLVINNSSGVTLGNSVNLENQLTLTSGSVTLSGHTLTYSSGTYGWGSPSLEYNGSSAQSTGSELPSNLKYLIINNSSGVTLNSGTNITSGGNITLTAGNIILNSNTITWSGVKNYIYNGSSAQSTGGELPSTVDNLTINNSAGVTLVSPVTVGTALTFTNGTLALGSNKLIIGSSGSISGASSTNYVMTNGTGVLEMNASVSGVLYPVGDSYNPITITDAGGNTWDVGVSDGITNGSNGAIATDAINRTWTIMQSSGSPVAVTVAPQWTNTSDWAGGVFNQTNDIVSSRTSLTTAWTPSQSPTSDHNVSGSFYNLTSGSINIATATQYYIGVGDNISALPVSLINFNADYYTGQVNLNWETASEINNNYFEIERSANGQSWINIGKVAGHGNSMSREDYEYIDYLMGVVPSGTLYYRLKQVDFNGNFQYSMIRAVTVSKNPAESMTYPNPVANILNINWMNPDDNDGVINIINASGLTIFSEKISGTGSVKKQLDMSGYPAGTYMVQVVSGNKRLMSQRFIKE